MSALIVRPGSHKAMRQAFGVGSAVHAMARNPAIKRGPFIPHRAAQLDVFRAAAGAAQLRERRGRQVNVTRRGDRRLQLICSFDAVGHGILSAVPRQQLQWNGRERRERIERLIAHSQNV